jgi:hypothetical protein
MARNVIGTYNQQLEQIRPAARSCLLNCSVMSARRTIHLRQTMLLAVAALCSLTGTQCGDSTRPQPNHSAVRPSLTGRWVGTMVEPNGVPSQRSLEFQFEEDDSTLTAELSLDHSTAQALFCQSWKDTLKLVLPSDTGGFLSFIGIQQGYALSGEWGSWGKDVTIETGTWYATKQ